MENSVSYLKQLREQKGLSYEDMAKRLKISKSYYWQIEHKNRRLSYEMARSIAEIFDLKPDAIFYEDYKKDGN